MEKKRIIFYLGGGIVMLCVVFLPGYSQLEKIREDNRQYLQRIELLEMQNEKLAVELNRMKEDPLYLETKAREKLGIVKKGEIIYYRKEQ